MKLPGKKCAIMLFYVAAAAAPAAAQEPAAREPLKIGFVSTFSGNAGVLGQNMYDGFMLGLDHAGGKLGGVQTEVLKHDDQFKPDVGLKVVRELIERDKVNFVVGFVFSNVLLAAVKPALDAKTFVISGNAGPADLAGAKCSPYFFSASYQNDFNDEGAGLYFNNKGYKRAYLLAPNYVTGRDALAGFKRTFKGEVVGEVYTKLDQVDYSAELAQLRATKPDAVYIFYPGGFGINFVKQFYQAGLRGEFPLISKATVDMATLPAEGEAAVGSKEVAHWNWDLDNPANKHFVDDFVKKYKYTPSLFSESSYDAAQLIDSAVRQVKGDLTDKDALREAIEKADIQSPRGSFKFNTNHFPIHANYVIEAVKKSDGTLTLVTEQKLRDAASDSFAAQCPMK
jgi:branched-chain amino acid transport system substrate-binding protein